MPAFDIHDLSSKPADDGQVSSGHGDVISELIKNGSIELTDRAESIAGARDMLPYGMRVYIPSLPNRPLITNLDKLRLLHEAGFDPVPHVAARRITSREELKKFLGDAVKDCGVRRVLLIGGDLDRPLGPYRDAADILKDGILKDSGIREIGLGGYPEGHPRISNKQLEESLQEKLELASTLDLGTSVVTQFSFVPSRIVEYCAYLSRTMPDVPVYIGMAGPTDPVKLMKYAKICGVSASLRALSALGFKAARLVSHTDPKEQLEVLARHMAARGTSNIMGVHIFSFGGFTHSAAWMHNTFLETRNG